MGITLNLCSNQMSYLIEDFSQEACPHQSSHTYTQKNQPSTSQKASRTHFPKAASTSLRVDVIRYQKAVLHQNDPIIFKSGIFSLIVLKKIKSNGNYQLEGVVLENDQKMTIRFKEKRIYFGKQLIKQKKQFPIKVQIDFLTGEVKLYWAQIFINRRQSMLCPKQRQKRSYQKVFLSMKKFFQQEFIPAALKILHQSVPKPSQTQKISLQSFISNKEPGQQKFRRIQRYLYMSTTVDSFQKDKQTYKKLQDRINQQKDGIFKIQNTIDISFCNINSEIKLYAETSLTEVKQNLIHFGNLSIEEQNKIQNYIDRQSSKNYQQNQYQYIYNCIGILKVQNKKRFISSGGTSSIYMAKMMFQYIYSDDPKYWIQENKKNLQNALQKCFVIKEPKIGFQEKLRHENSIVKQMKGGYSVYLSKYYRVENIQKGSCCKNTQDLIIMDFLKGQTLGKYTRNNKQYLSFWTKIYILRNIINGLRFLSNYKIVHLDLKPSNLIVIGDMMTKIIDFSESFHFQVCKQNFKPGLSFPYCAPQIIMRKSGDPDQKCDVFSLGMIMYELFLKQKPLQIEKDKLFKIYSGYSYMQRIFLSPQLVEELNISPIIRIMLVLIMRCLEPRPSFRPTLNWISIIINQILESFKSY